MEAQWWRRHLRMGTVAPCRLPAVFQSCLLLHLTSCAGGGFNSRVSTVGATQSPVVQCAVAMESAVRASDTLSATLSTGH